MTKWLRLKWKCSRDIKILTSSSLPVLCVDVQRNGVKNQADCQTVSAVISLKKSNKQQVKAQRSRTRQIIQYRATATLRRPQIQQHTAQKEGGGGLQNSQGHKVIDLNIIWKDITSVVCMPNMKSLTIQNYSEG